MILKGFGPPTAQTVAKVGDKYFDQESCKTYECISVKGSTVDYGFVDIHRHAPENEYEWAVANRPKAYSAYHFCYSGERLDLVPLVDFSECINFNSMFENAYAKMTEVPSLDTTCGTKFESMFKNCTALTTVPPMNLSSSTTCRFMFSGCTQLRTVPAMDFKNVVSVVSMFENTSNLTEVPYMDTSNCKKFAGMFEGSGVQIINGIDFNSANDLNSAVLGTKLTTLRVYNARISFSIGIGTTYGHLLTIDSLVHTIKELCTATSQQTLTMGSTNLAKIADLYCKVTDSSTEKLDMELCESTDDGAMTLADYAALKNWVFA